MATEALHPLAQFMTLVERRRLVSGTYSSRNGVLSRRTPDGRCPLGHALPVAEYVASYGGRSMGNPMGSEVAGFLFARWYEVATPSEFFAGPAPHPLYACMNDAAHAFIAAWDGGRIHPDQLPALFGVETAKAAN